MVGNLDYEYVAVIAGMLALLLVLIFMLDYKIARIEKKLDIVIASFKKPNDADNATSREKNPKKAKKQ